MCGVWFLWEPSGCLTMAVHSKASQSVQILLQGGQEDRTGRGDRYTELEIGQLHNFYYFST